MAVPGVPGVPGPGPLPELTFDFKANSRFRVPYCKYEFDTSKAMTDKDWKEALQCVTDVKYKKSGVLKQLRIPDLKKGDTFTFSNDSVYEDTQYTCETNMSLANPSAYGTLWKVVNGKGEYVVMKIQDARKEDDRMSGFKEYIKQWIIYTISKNNNHDDCAYTASTFGFGIASDFTIQVMTFAGNQNFGEYLARARLSYVSVERLIAKIARKLDRLQKNINFTHLDFHSANAMVNVIPSTVPVIKLIDFGKSYMKLDQLEIGTPTMLKGKDGLDLAVFALSAYEKLANDSHSHGVALSDLPMYRTVFMPLFETLKKLRTPAPNIARGENWIFWRLGEPPLQYANLNDLKSTQPAEFLSKHSDKPNEPKPCVDPPGNPKLKSGKSEYEIVPSSGRPSPGNGGCGVSSPAATPVQLPQQLKVPGVGHYVGVYKPVLENLDKTIAALEKQIIDLEADKKGKNNAFKQAQADRIRIFQEQITKDRAERAAIIAKEAQERLDKKAANDRWDDLVRKEINVRPPEKPKDLEGLLRHIAMNKTFAMQTVPPPVKIGAPEVSKKIEQLFKAFQRGGERVEIKLRSGILVEVPQNISGFGLIAMSELFPKNTDLHSDHHPHAKESHILDVSEGGRRIRRNDVLGRITRRKKRKTKGSRKYRSRK